MTTAVPTSLIDELMPRFDAVERHALVVHAAPADVYAALRRVDLRSAPLIRALLFLRALPGALSGQRRERSRGPLTLDAMRGEGFVLLGERPGTELALGLVGRFWTATGQILRLDAEVVRTFDEPGYAKAVWDFRLAAQPDGTTRLSTETRVRCLDAPSRRRFRLYWWVIRPFSGLIRLALLRAVAREATGRTR
jgi:hypothetical protein